MITWRCGDFPSSQIIRVNNFDLIGKDDDAKSFFSTVICNFLWALLLSCSFFEGQIVTAQV